jgi:multidrug efflux pump subunit AcrA (membrane-fusion protein)
MRRVIRWLVGIVVLLLVLAGLAWGAWAAFWPKQTSASLREEAIAAEVSSMEDVLVVTGLVKPAVTIDLRAEASGIVEAVAVREGDRVVEGQELVRLDSKMAKAALEQAEANLRQAELQDAATRLDLDEDSLELKRKTLERTQALFDRGLIAKETLETRELEYRVAQRGVERAKRNIESSQARIAQMRASASQAQTQLQHTTVRAPFDAFVLRRMVEIGSGVAGVSSTTGGSIIMTLGDAKQSALYAKATAADAKRLKPGLAARVRLDSDTSDVLTGVVKSVSMAGDIDQSTRLTTFPVLVTLNTQPAGGWVNVPAQADIVLSASTKSVSVPERCVRTDPSGRSWVRVRGKTGDRARTVEVGVIQKDRIQIRSGIDAGDLVVCRTQ